MTMHQLQVLSSRHTQQWEEFVRKVMAAWTAIAHPAPPKPHWAKWNAPFLNDSDDFVGQYAQAAFWEQIPAFRAAVLEADPIGVFRNRWLERLFHLDQV